MKICLFGVSCTGKTSVSLELVKKMKAKLINGKEYLKLAKSHSEALFLFKKILNEETNLIFVTSELDDLKLLPKDMVRVLFTASLDTIKQRFAKRLNQNLLLPVEKMLEKKHSLFSQESYDLLVDTDKMNMEEICNLILNYTK